MTDDVVEELDSLGLRTGVEIEEDPDAREGVSGESIRTPFDPEKIDVVTRNTTVDLLLSRVRSGRIDLQPDFQRRAGIWKASNKSRLIESLLLRIPLPTFYAAEGDDEVWAMVDGIQRLTSIVEFIEPKSIGAQPLRLCNLEYLGAEYNDAAFADLPGRLQTRLRETELIVHLIRRGTPDEVKFNIFARINTGGLPLSRQELRHALIPGQARDILRDWAGSEVFRQATGNSVRSERMADREMVLRFIAFQLTDPYRYGEEDFDAFLRSSMKRLSALSRTETEVLRARFERSMVAAAEIFGVHAFRKRNRAGGEWKHPINKALFESVAGNLAAVSDEELQLLVQRRKIVGENFVELMGDVEFQLSISQGTGDPGQVRRRFVAIRNLFGGVCAS